MSIVYMYIEFADMPSYGFNLKKHISVNVSWFFSISDDETCPVRTFCRYKSKLNKNSAFLFQRPKSNTVSHCWYDSVPVGHNTLGNMMTTISKDCQLSKIYTNHSLRTTTDHLLDVVRFPDRHIMSVTGHMAESSLKTYTGYTDSKTKQKMSNTLSSVLRFSDNNVQKVDTCKTEKCCEQYWSLFALTCYHYLIHRKISWYPIWKWIQTLMTL
jgi:hypothetical protein